ncbi:MAG: alpha/beta hydrolase [Myxococcota bacterium]
MLLLATALTLAATPPRGAWAAIELEGKLDGRVGKAPLHVYVPAGTAKQFPLVIALPGWNHTPELWRSKSDLGALADRYGFVLAVPQLGKSIYETRFYPESKSSWTVAPGARWVGEVVLPWLRAHYPVASERAHTAIIGYSTGGRGALLVAEAYPEFAFVGSLSGTFDLLRLDPKDGEYRIHAALYGERDAFPERWKLDNCVEPARLEQLGDTRVYAAHGADDRVVKPDQLAALQGALPAGEFVLVPRAGHDWAFWNAQWPVVFERAAKALSAPARGSPSPR